MSDSLTEILDHLRALRAAAVAPGNLDQWGLIVVALLAGWLVRRLLRQAAPAGPSARLPDLLVPAVALAVVALGWRLLFHRAAVPLLQLAVPLLLSMCLIRIGIRILRTVLKAEGDGPGDWERRLVRGVWALFALHVLGVLDPVLEMLDERTLPLGEHQVSVLHLLQGGMLLLGAVVVSLWLGSVFERRVMAISRIDVSLRVILTKLIHGTLLALAVLITLPLVGIDITFLSVLGGAVGVGLGFGLQKIASNYVSGFIILLERSVRLNDVITVDGRKGLVSHMEARYTVLKSADGNETIIPNETFVTAIVINHTLNDRAGSVSFNLWLDHEADVHRSIALLEAMLLAEEVVARTPAPAVQVVQVTETGIEIVVGWWVPDLARNDPAFRPAMLLKALDVLREAGIALARRPPDGLPRHPPATLPAPAPAGIPLPR